MVSILITAFKSEKTIKKCIDSILSQNYQDFEVIVVEDPPFDGTQQIIQAYNDDRITYIANEYFKGLSESRNVTVKNSIGKYLFFTDSDCIVSNNWIESGLSTIQNNTCLGVEGKLLYVSETYEPTYSDRVVQNRFGNEYMTANMVYTREIIERVGGFDPDYTYFEDRDLAERIMKFGLIQFNKNMVVFHQYSLWGVVEFLNSAKRSGNRVLLFEKLNFKLDIWWRIYFPINLLEIIFPPIFLGFPLKYRFKHPYDLVILLLTYPKLILERLILWKMSLSKHVFII